MEEDSLQSWLDDFYALIERIKPLVRSSEENSTKACVAAIALLMASTKYREQCSLDILCEALGAWSGSEVFIIEKKIKERNIVQAGILPAGTTVSFQNN